MRVLLLNLPYRGKRLQRDLSCPHTSKADYYWPGIDLIAYSGIFSDEELFLIDAVKDELDMEKCCKKIEEIKPELILTMISAISLQDDLKIFREIKKRMSVKIGASGDLCSFEASKVFKNKEIDYVITDFTEKDKIRNILKDKKRKIISSTKKKEFSLGMPRHELFKKYDYKMPYSFYKPVTSLITNFGCPYRCKFCNSNNFNFKARRIEEVIEEMRYIQKCGIREVYIRDLTFGLPRIKQLLAEMIKAKINLKWSCEFRVDLADEEILSLMKKAGCFLIFYGGESGNQKTLDLMKKGFKIEQLKKAIKLTKKAGIETLVSFIIGFESENEADIMNTKRLILETDPDYISINILVPRIGSDFREEVGSEEATALDNSEEKGRQYANGKFAQDYKKEIEKEFFFRPGKLAKYFFLSAKTSSRFINFLKSGISIFERVKR